MYLRTALRLLWLAGTAGMAQTMAMAQTVDYPVQRSKTPEAKAAGIGSYHLTREGEIVTAEVFGPEGEPLADCEARWLEDSRVMTCTMAHGGRFRATWYEQRAEFEDITTGDHFSVHKEGPSLREIMAMEPESRPEHWGWVIRGTETWEEVERDWGHVNLVLGNLMGEIEITLGILAEHLSPMRSVEAQ